MRPVPHAFPAENAPLLSLSALEQAARIRDGSLKSVDLVRLYLDRIAAHGPAVNAFVSVSPGRALRDAEAADTARARGKRLGAFHGVPTAMKDLHLVRGEFTRMGSRAWKYLWSPVDDRTTKAVRRAGFVITGKTTTSELALLPITEPPIHPPTRNPWNTGRTSGGSSGGAGAAIAGGLLPIAPGSDGAGSVRIPSSLCGLVGLKPTRGLVPHSFKSVDVFEMASVGPMARDVDDCAALLDVLVERDPHAPGSFLAAARTPARRLKLALLMSPPTAETDPRIAARVLDAVAVLRAQGHTVEEIAPVRAELSEFLPVYQLFMSRLPVVLESKLGPMVAWFRAEGRKHRLADVRARFEALAKRTVDAVGSFDGLVSPTVPVLPPEVGAFSALAPPDQFNAAAPLGSFTAPWNVTGWPALTLPWGRVEGLPAGVQLVGRPGTDGELFSIARELASARPEGVLPPA